MEDILTPPNLDFNRITNHHSNVKMIIHIAKTVIISILYIVVTRRAAAHLGQQHIQPETTAASKVVPRHDHDYDVIIIGGGITGLATAAALIHREKIPQQRICIIEKSNEIRPRGSTIDLFPNGLVALESISSELADAVCASGIQARGSIRKYLNSDVEEKIEAPNLDETDPGSHTVAWYLLQEHLLAMVPDGVIQFGKVLHSIEMDHDDSSDIADEQEIIVCYRDRQSDIMHEATCRVLIGADGIKSTVRDILFPSYRENNDANHNLNQKMFHATLRRDELDGTVQSIPPEGYTVTYRCEEINRVFTIRQLAQDVFGFTCAVTPADGTEEIADEDANPDATKGKLMEYLKDYPLDIQQWIDVVNPKAIYENNVCDIEVPDRWSRGACVIIGDAAHTMLPSLGHGANIGLEDSTELAAIIGSVLKGDNNGSAAEIRNALEIFWKRRIERVKRIYAVSRENINGSKVDAEFRGWVYGWQPSFGGKVQRL